MTFKWKSQHCVSLRSLPGFVESLLPSSPIALLKVWINIHMILWSLNSVHSLHCDKIANKFMMSVLMRSIDLNILVSYNNFMAMVLNLIILDLSSICRGRWTGVDSGFSKASVNSSELSCHIIKVIVTACCKRVSL